MASTCACSSLKRQYEDSDDESTRAVTSWKKAFKTFSNNRRLNLPTKRTLLIQWKDFSEGFLKRESEEVIFKTLPDEESMYKKMFYSGDMFDHWKYFSPLEMKDKEWYKQNSDLTLINDEKIKIEILHLAMAVKAANLDEYPGSSPQTLDDARAQDVSAVNPSHIAYLYWEARAQGFHNLRGKLFAEAFMRLLFTGIENVTFSYSTAGYDTHLDRWGYIEEGPTEILSGHYGSGDHLASGTQMNSRKKYLMMLKNLDSLKFDLKASLQKATSDVFVNRGNDLVLIAEVANVHDIESKKMQQLHRHMLLSLDKHETLFGLLVQGHQIYLAEYTFEHSGGYKRSFSQKAFKYTKDDMQLLYSYLQKHFIEKQGAKRRT